MGLRDRQRAYNIVDNHCHDATLANLSKTNGLVACQKLSSTTPWGGHTVARPSAKVSSASRTCRLHRMHTPVR